MTDRKALGTQVTNQAYTRYDQVEKKQEYHLAEGRHDEAFDEDTRIRTCDIGRFLRGAAPDRKAFSREMALPIEQHGALAREHE